MFGRKSLLKGFGGGYLDSEGRRGREGLRDGYWEGEITRIKRGEGLNGVIYVFMSFESGSSQPFTLTYAFLALIFMSTNQVRDSHALK